MEEKADPSALLRDDKGFAFVGCLLPGKQILSFLLRATPLFAGLLRQNGAGLGVALF